VPALPATEPPSPPELVPATFISPASPPFELPAELVCPPLPSPAEKLLPQATQATTSTKEKQTLNIGLFRRDELLPIE
jgi:hypothetical protein